MGGGTEGEGKGAEQSPRREVDVDAKTEVDAKTKSDERGLAEKLTERLLEKVPEKERAGLAGE